MRRFDWPSRRATPTRRFAPLPGRRHVRHCRPYAASSRRMRLRWSVPRVDRATSGRCILFQMRSARSSAVTSTVSGDNRRILAQHLKRHLSCGNLRLALRRPSTRSAVAASANRRGIRAVHHPAVFSREDALTTNFVDEFAAKAPRPMEAVVAPAISARFTRHDRRAGYPLRMALAACAACDCPIEILCP